jgi:hypothetical protein
VGESGDGRAHPPRRPAVERIRTGNAFSNAPMLAINDALGFIVVSTRTEWQADPVHVRRALAS